jgi:hypothetical protein
MRRLVPVAAVIVGGVMTVRWLLTSGEPGQERQPGATMIGRMMRRMMERLPADSPPKLIMSILPELRKQNHEIIALLREQNELLRRERESR